MNIETINYDIDFFNKILEMIKNSTYKIKNFFRPKNNQFEFYYLLDREFDKIADSLELYDVLYNEFSEFLGVKRKVLNIVYNNCKNPSFGHCDFAIKILEEFNKLLASKINLLSNFTSHEEEKYNEIYLKYKVSMKEIDKEFHLNIYKPMHNVFTPQKVYEIMEECKW